MNKYKCLICGYVHDEEKEGKFDNLPEDWVCPICGANKSVFEAEEMQDTKDSSVTKSEEVMHDERELTSLELSAICSNLARGCEKQYLKEESELFLELSKKLKDKQVKANNEDMNTLLNLVEKDLNENFKSVLEVASKNGDRGALRAYTWSNKVSMLVKSLLKRYQTAGDAMIENTGVYVCTICGFIYVGDKLPDICPICKVQSDKFEEIGGNQHE